MCKPQEHLSKYENNKKLVEHLEGYDFSDWQITGCFYAGLHKLNAYLHLQFKAEEYDINSHDKIKQYLKNKRLTQLEQEYINFQNLSHAARYNFADMSLRVSVAKKYLDNMDKSCVLGR